MATKKVSIFISLKDGVSSGLQKINGALKITGRGFKAVAKAGAAAFGIITAGALLLASTVKKAFDFETLRTQIKVLVGSTIEAKRVFDELKEFSASTPFELPGIVAAYRQLKNFTGPALSTKKGLTLVGDAAAATSSDFKETAFWTGRLYSSLKNGSPFLDSVGAMERLGIVGGELRGTLTKLSSDGATMGEMWGLVEKDMLKFEGGMKELSSTGNGLISTLKDNWSIAVATFGEAFMDSAKGGITEMINTIKRLVDNGTITAWAEQAKGALQAVVDTIKIITGGGDAATDTVSAMANVIKSAFIDGAMLVIDILTKFAPVFGNLLAASIKGAVLSGGQGSADRAVAEKRISDRGDFERSIPFTPMARRNEEKIQKEIEQIGKDRAESFEKGLSDALSDAGGRTKVSIAALRETIAEGLEGLEAQVPKSASKGGEQKPLGEQIAESIGKGFEAAVPATPSGGGSSSLSGNAADFFDILSSRGMGTGSILENLEGMDLGTPEMLTRLMDRGMTSGQALDRVSNGPADKTNSLLKEQNKILEDKLGGVK